ncbi:hypothetical protein RhiJN_28106 [Ceratobasidium sp. AG-Ba]|nr:hypothetical protein RhiJN_28106 [Ceratobasidium sp. AG-Ba]
MPRQPRAHPARNNQADNGAGQPGAQNPHENDGITDEEEPLPPNATPAQMRELQLDRTNTKRQLTDVTRERDQLLTASKSKRRRSRYVDEPTSDDPKYDKAGKRCALMRQLWVLPELFETEPDPTYTAERRYNQDEPEMNKQGDLLDLLDSAPPLRQNLLQSVHFQRVQDLNKARDRKHNDEFKRLLGYRAREDRGQSGKRYHSLPPILYDNDAAAAAERTNEHIFRNAILKRLFRACVFGPSTVSDDRGPTDPNGQHVLARILGLKSITPGAIAFSATLARWAISPDDEFSEKGKSSGIDYKKDYDKYKELIVKGLASEQGVFEATAAQGPFMKLINEWNSEFFRNRQNANQRHAQDENARDSDFENAEEQIENYAHDPEGQGQAGDGQEGSEADE